MYDEHGINLELVTYQLNFKYTAYIIYEHFNSKVIMQLITIFEVT